MPRTCRANWAFSEYTIIERPKFAAHIGTIASLWALAENRLGEMFAHILGADAELGTAMYLALISEQARDAAMLAAVDNKLDPALRNRFDELMTKLRITRKKRNNVIHGLWAVHTEEKPDCLILLDPKAVVRMWALLGAKNAGASLTSDKYTESWNKMSTTLEYKEKDFVEIENEILDNISKISSFSLELKSKHWSPPFRTDGHLK